MSNVKKYGNFEAEIMADSSVEVDGNVHRLLSFRIVFSRNVLAELNTHRLFSRNSASSRAIPASKMIEWVSQNPFIPDRFPKNHKGMQASEWVNKEDESYSLWEKAWLMARDTAVATSRFLNQMGMSKQLTNRILEPFLMHQVIVTATEWDNFFYLRADQPAQNEIRIIAEMMLEAANESTPNRLSAGEWHLPFGDKLDKNKLSEYLDDEFPTLDDLRVAVTVARCARVSYLNFEGKDDYAADLALYKQLKDSGHMSPFEHAARAMSPDEYYSHSHTYPDRVEYGWCGNFVGFIQSRKLFPSSVENRHEPRLLKKG